LNLQVYNQSVSFRQRHPLPANFANEWIRMVRWPNLKI